MLFKIGDLVSRNSYHNDTIFKIMAIDGEIASLKGVNIRLYADSAISDLKKVESDQPILDDSRMMEKMDSFLNLERNEYFYLPGKVLHIDGDQEYLDRCMTFYKKFNIMAYGVNLRESEIALEIAGYLEDLNPDIVVITGHDAYYKNNGDIHNIENYKNTKNFVDAIKATRKYEHSQEKLVIIAGACQSDYEELIKAGANFASSPKRVNIHALDPAIVACSIGLSDKNKPIDLIKILDKTKYGKAGIGGIITNGMMFVGYPR
ncbi:MAG: sporulation peptidase YabG [Bacilli bacterium]